ncbi:MAG: hypothetical protein AAGJ87_09195 [Pseudomonadota bacterium]
MRFAIALALLGLAGCVTATGTAYAPADSRGYGYEEVRLEQDRFRIIFRGDGATPPDIVEDFALLRAAELTVENGYDWFRVVGRDLNGEERGGANVGLGVGSGSFGRRGGVSVGVGGDLGRVGSRRFFTARLEALFGSGEKPDDGEVYDARSIIDSIGRRTAAPAP